MCLCVERGLGHAQAGVLCHDGVQGELVPVGDFSPGRPDPRQEGWTVTKRHCVFFPGARWGLFSVNRAHFLQRTQKERCVSEKILLIDDIQSRE